MSEHKGDCLTQLFSDERRHEAAEKLKSDFSIELTEAQRAALIKSVEAHGTFPSSIEIRVHGSVDRSTLFPVTVLVGAMT